jgi:hypothetical protein
MAFELIQNASLEDVVKREDRIFEKYYKNLHESDFEGAIPAKSMRLHYIKSEGEFIEAIVKYEMLGGYGSLEKPHFLDWHVLNIKNSENGFVDLYFFPVSRMNYMVVKATGNIFGFSVDCEGKQDSVYLNGNMGFNQA